MKFKLPPRFKIFHNVPEDYYFIKERFYLFWYRTMKTLTGYEYYSIDRYASLEEAEEKIQFILLCEKESQIPETIKLVKEL
jgi:hypothetical protein